MKNYWQFINEGTYHEFSSSKIEDSLDNLGVSAGGNGWEDGVLKFDTDHKPEAIFICEDRNEANEISQEIFKFKAMHINVYLDLNTDKSLICIIEDDLEEEYAAFFINKDDIDSIEKDENLEYYFLKTNSTEDLSEEDKNLLKSYKGINKFDL